LKSVTLAPAGAAKISSASPARIAGETTRRTAPV
jgi:hypothetical protein